ncbi:dendrin isoform X2 [Hemicordylus capensis]|nr:dendrin isoform X2 [Hemicordylus capensis]XP_053145197.1 dendrin isoform X2 [Hemicordylus capensis]XP_053145198.1 dendrin isoform X2 [Hemicordylus capensis]
MEGRPWTGQGYRAPWMYHSVAGQYTLLEKQLVPDFSPCQRRLVVPRILQDSTNWQDAQPPSRWGLVRQEGRWLSGKELSRAAAAGAASPKAQRQYSPAYEGLRPLSRRDLSWEPSSPTAKDRSRALAGGAAPHCPWNQGAPAKSRADLPARAPPSYETHMLLRLRAGHGPRKENWPRPPPYVPPPSYEAPHRTVQPQQRGCSSARGHPAVSKQLRKEAPKKCRETSAGACELRPLPALGAGRKAGRHYRAPMPGGWSYLSGATTWGGPRMPPEPAEPPYCWDRSPQCRSHTLPRVNRRSKGGAVPCPPLLPPPHGQPQDSLPAGWGFSHAVSWPGGALGKAGKQSRDLLPKWKEPRPARTQQAANSLAASPAPPRPAPQRPGGLFVIDATCVVIQAHYIPPPRTQHVRYLGQQGAGQGQAGAAAAPVSMEERAARILGLPVSELGFTQTRRQGLDPEMIPGHGAGESCPADPGAAPADVPGGAPSPPRGTPKKPLLPAPAAPSSCEAAGPLVQQGPPGCPHESGVAVPGQGGDGCCCQPPGEEEPVFCPSSRSYVRDLKEAMSRIRRHTAPDSDTDEELEKECQTACGPRPRARRGRLNEGALSYSSSSLESSESNATVVPGNATPTLLRNGHQTDSELTLDAGSNAGPSSALTMKRD